MKTLKARIKKTSPHYEMGLDLKGRPVWLSVTGFRATGERNFRVNAIKDIRGGFAEYREIWCRHDELTFRHIEDSQLSMDLYSREEMKKQKYNPRLFNRRRFEVLTSQEKFYVHAPDMETARQMARQLDIIDFEIRQVKGLSKNEINE